MKKLILATAILMNIGIFTFAQTNSFETENISVDTPLNPFRIVTLDELNDKVQATITEYKSIFTIKMITYDENLKLTLVTLEDPDTKFEKTLIINDNGEIM